MIIVIGAGPAGMMAAIRAGELGQEVILIEKNSSPGRKLLLSGKGRCNLTNACSLDLFLERFSHRAEFLRDAFKIFFNQDLIDFFTKRGLALKVERQQRVFPQTDRSASIVDILEKELKKNKVEVIFQTALKDILIKSGKVQGVLLSGGRAIQADKLILATGGISFAFTGSSGETFELVKKSGHRIVVFKPGLVPLVTKEHYPALLEGLALENIRLKFSAGKKQIISEVGDLIFTKFGISGPLVLSLSGRIVDMLEDNKSVHLAIDLKPALSVEQLDARLLREFKLNAKKSFKNTLKTLLPLRLIDVFMEIARIDPLKVTCQITQKERKTILSLLKGLELDIVRPLAIEEAMVTRGGVDLREINPRTMESRLVKGLYFAGEMIDVDADTGGFNLQAAFSTGYLAGESAAKG